MCLFSVFLCDIFSFPLYPEILSNVIHNKLNRLNKLKELNEL